MQDAMRTHARTASMASNPCPWCGRGRAPWTEVTCPDTGASIVDDVDHVDRGVSAYLIDVVTILDRRECANTKLMFPSDDPPIDRASYFQPLGVPMMTPVSAEVTDRNELACHAASAAAILA